MIKFELQFWPAKPTFFGTKRILHPLTPAFTSRIKREKINSVDFAQLLIFLNGKRLLTLLSSLSSSHADIWYESELFKAFSAAAKNLFFCVLSSSLPNENFNKMERAQNWKFYLRFNNLKLPLFRALLKVMEGISEMIFVYLMLHLTIMRNNQ